MPCKRLRTLAKLSVLTTPIILTACSTTMDSAVNDLSFCAAAQPIRWSTKDTQETVWQIKEHNAVGRVSCGWGTNNGK